jgi:hypothetical protein
MCPLCVTTVTLSLAGATSGASVMALVARKWRIMRRWLAVVGATGKSTRAKARNNHHVADRLPEARPHRGGALRHGSHA